MARPPLLMPMENLEVAEPSMGYAMSTPCIEEWVCLPTASYCEPQRSPERS